jgi:hypothetical protein
MRKFFASRLTFVAILILFVSAFTWNVVHGAGVGSTVGGHILTMPDVWLIAHNPAPGPDGPYDVRVAHGPTLPPDPYPEGGNVRVAHGPTLPPDPYPEGGNVRVAHGPTLPPDPYPEGGNVRVAHGPLPDPDPLGPDGIAA